MIHMLGKPFVALVLAAALGASACAHAPEAPVVPRQVVAIGSVEAGAAALSADDEFMAVVTPADISIRTRSPDGTKADLIRTYQGAVAPWTDAERARLEAMLARHAAQLQSLSRWLPEQALMIKSNGAADTALPHTRGAVINMGSHLPEQDAQLDGLFFHELFHVLSRHNASRHDEMYALINFAPCAISLPDEARARTITNPDAPFLHWVAPLGGEGRFVVPVLFADPPRFDPARPQFNNYFDLRFLQAARDSAGQCALTLTNGQPVDVPQPEAIAALHAAAGANTNYVLHPEELLADNFSQLMMGRTDIPNPEVHARLAAFLGITAPAGAN